MADVASSFKDWSTTAANNGPDGTATVGAGLDDNIRQIQATAKTALGHIVSAANYGTLTSTPGADINLAIDAVNTAGGGTATVPPGSYSIETSILLKSGVVLDLTGCVLTAASGLNSPLIKNATSITIKTVSGITRSGRTATATSAGHGYSNGDWVFISGVTQQDYNGAHQIFNVATDTFDFYVAKTATTPATTGGTMRVYKSVESDVVVKGGNLVGDASNTTGDNYGILFHGVNRFAIDGVYAHGFYHTQIGVISGVNGVISGSTGNQAVHSSHNGFLLGTANGGPDSGYAYVRNISVIDCTADLNAQDGYVFQAGHNVRVTNCSARRNTLSGFKPCQTFQVQIDNCTAERNTGHGIQLQASLGVADISIKGNICRENAESGILVGNIDSSNPATQVSIVGNICDRNGQVGSSTAYGIAFEPNASCTVDQVVITGNICTTQTRGISFGSNGTVSNVYLGGNFTKGNTADIICAASFQTATATIGFNPGNVTTGGYPMEVHSFQFWTDNLPQNSGTVTLSDGFGGRGYMVPRVGYIRSLAVKSNASVAAGTATFQLRVNGSISGSFNVVMDTTNPTFNITSANIQAVTVAAGDMITITCASNGSFLPNGTADFDAVAEVVY